MKLNLIIILISFFTFLNVADAECSYNDNVRLSKYASNVKVGYDFTQNNNIVTYTIDLLNLTPELKIEVTNNSDQNFFEFDYINGNTSYNFDTSDKEVTHTYKIYANTHNCYDVLLRSLKIITPKFNKYSLRSECNNHPDFDLCQKFNPKNITDEIFNRELNLYNLSEENIIDNPAEDEGVLESGILDFINNKIIFFVAISIISLLVVGIFIFLKIRKNKKYNF